MNTIFRKSLCKFPSFPWSSTRQCTSAITAATTRVYSNPNQTLFPMQGTKIHDAGIINYWKKTDYSPNSLLPYSSASNSLSLSPLNRYGMVYNQYLNHDEEHIGISELAIEEATKSKTTSLLELGTHTTANALLILLQATETTTNGRRFWISAYCNRYGMVYQYLNHDEEHIGTSELVQVHADIEDATNSKTTSLLEPGTYTTANPLLILLQATKTTTNGRRSWMMSAYRNRKYSRFLIPLPFNSSKLICCYWDNDDDVDVVDINADDDNGDDNSDDDNSYNHDETDDSIKTEDVLDDDYKEAAKKWDEEFKNYNPDHDNRHTDDDNTYDDDKADDSIKSEDIYNDEYKEAAKKFDEEFKNYNPDYYHDDSDKSSSTDTPPPSSSDESTANTENNPFKRRKKN